MIEKLRSHLRKSKGFTLVELLVVIAIIAILVLIVIVAINPAERINDARDKAAESDVRSTASAMEACLAWVDPITNVQNTVANCDAAGLIAATNGGPWVRSVPAGVTLAAGNISKAGRAGTVGCYNYNTGQVSLQTDGTCP